MTAPAESSSTTSARIFVVFAQDVISAEFFGRLITRYSVLSLCGLAASSSVCFGI